MELWNNLDTNGKIASAVALAAPLLYLGRKVFSAFTMQINVLTVSSTLQEV